MTNTTDPISVSVPVGHIEAALQAVSKEQLRYHLTGVFLDARGYIASTNGHILFAARCDDARKLASCPSPAPGGLSGVIVPADALLQAGKAARKTKLARHRIERDERGQWWILLGVARIAFTPIDGSFPDWARVVPTAPETRTAAHFQPQYIAALGNMAKALRDGAKDAASQFTLHQDGANPALVTFPCKDEGKPRADCLAVIMPYRMDSYADADFTGEFLAAAKAAKAADAAEAA